MSRIGKLLNRIGLTTTSQSDKRANLRYQEGYYDQPDKRPTSPKRSWRDRISEAIGQGGEDEPPIGDARIQGYRQGGSGGFMVRELKVSQDTMINTAWILYQQNPMARWILRTKRNFVLGRNIQFVADDPALQVIIDKFCERNKFKDKLKEFVLQEHLFGEQILPAFVRLSDGQVTLAYIDPQQVESVVTHPENVLERWAVILKDDQVGKKMYRIIRTDEGFVRRGPSILDKDIVIQSQHPELLLTAEQSVKAPFELEMLNEAGLDRYTGSTFYFHINALSNQPRGFSDLLPLADFLDAAGDVLFGLAEREMMANFFAFVVKLIGTKKEDLEKRAKELRSPPKRGSILLTNDSEEWDMFSPDLNQPGSIDTIDALTKYILGSESFPFHWFGSGEGTNRATADAQGTPAGRAMQAIQDDHRLDILEVLHFVRDQAQIVGQWQPLTVHPETGEQIKDPGKIEVIMPEMISKDVGTAATVLSQVVAALLVAKEDLQVLTDEPIARLVGKMINELGIEFDPLEELEKLKVEGTGDNSEEEMMEYLAEILARSEEK